MKLLCLITFVLFGTAGGVIFQIMHNKTSMLFNIMLGILGSLGLSRLGLIIGIGRGFLSFSFSGLLLGIAGSILLPLLYCRLASKKASPHDEEVPEA